MREKFYPPTYLEKQFHCPSCGVYATQKWSAVFAANQNSPSGLLELDTVKVALCLHCRVISIWQRQKMIFPSTSGVELPNDDLPLGIKEDYSEAAEIVNKSPRGAAALLRLAIQKLITHLGEKGKNINDDIANLVAKGLPVPIQQALDYVRVVGNEAVHPGQIDLKDDRETALKLFDLINFIAEDRITRPKQVKALYDTLPVDKLKAITDRDK